MKKLLYTRPDDGGVTIVIPAAKEKMEEILGPLSDAQYESHVRSRSIPVDAINVVELDESSLPDREFRNAWKQNGATIDFDLIKAKNIQLERIRLARAPKLDELDKEFMLALEQGDDVKKAEIVAAKQALRDITEPLKSLNPSSIDDIKASFPESLVENK